MGPSEIWKIQDMIKNGSLSFKKGDVVMLFTKRHDGYPKYIEIGTSGIVDSVELNHLIVKFDIADVNVSIPAMLFKLPKKFFANRQIIRELKINEILK